MIEIVQSRYFFGMEMRWLESGLSVGTIATHPPVQIDHSPKFEFQREWCLMICDLQIKLGTI